MNLSERAHTYFSAFASKDVGVLRQLLAQDAALRDWTVEVHGLEQVLGEMEKAFRAFNVITVHPLQVHQHGNLVTAELDIRLDAERLLVVDILEFNHDGVIAAIRAYKG